MKRILATLLAASLSLGMASAAFAFGGEPVTDEESLKEAIQEGGTVTLGDNITLTDTLQITNTVTIEGDYTLTAGGSGHGIVVSVGGNLTLKDVTIDGATGYGLQVYKSTADLTNVTISNSKKGGMLINGSTVTSTGLTLENNAWGGIEVGQGADVSNPASFTTDKINYTPAGETPVMWVDKATLDNVTVTSDYYESYLNEEKNQIWFRLKGEELPQEEIAIVVKDGDDVLEDSITIDLNGQESVEKTYHVSTDPAVTFEEYQFGSTTAEDNTIIKQDDSFLPEGEDLEDQLLVTATKADAGKTVTFTINLSSNEPGEVVSARTLTLSVVDSQDSTDPEPTPDPEPEKPSGGNGGGSNEPAADSSSNNEVRDTVSNMEAGDKAVSIDASNEPVGHSFFKLMQENPDSKVDMEIGNGSSLTFLGKDITSIPSNMIYFDLRMENDSKYADEMKAAAPEGAKSFVYSFPNYHGQLPGMATFSIKTNLSRGMSAYVYKYLGDGKFLEIAATEVGAGGVVSYQNNTMSDYIITTKPMENAIRQDTSDSAQTPSTPVKDNPSTGR